MGLLWSFDTRKSNGSNLSNVQLDSLILKGTFMRWQYFYKEIGSAISEEKKTVSHTL
jgi:hypothetical protein